MGLARNLFLFAMVPMRPGHSCLGDAVNDAKGIEERDREAGLQHIVKFSWDSPWSELKGTRACRCCGPGAIGGCFDARLMRSWVPDSSCYPLWCGDGDDWFAATGALNAPAFGVSRFGVSVFDDT